MTAPLRHDTEVSCVAFHPCGERIVTACSDDSLAERSAQQWEIATGQLFGPPMKHGDGVLWAAYSPDGTRAATTTSPTSVTTRKSRFLTSDRHQCTIG